MNRRVLLVEPAYKTKYPPLGLMKISTYHKTKGDEVTFVKGCSNKARYFYWDRIYISTLFTWTWPETVKTINFYRETLFGFGSSIYVGGILATLMPDELFNATGIQPVEGLLNEPHKIDQDDDIDIDHLCPDYDILRQVEGDNFKYSHTDAYLGYTSRGCIRRCEFCAVPIFEPKFVPYVDIKPTVQEIKNAFGEKQNLVLMDNNVLASPKFDEIIDDIKSLGFVKGAMFGPAKRKRFVDFNQGLDPRLLTGNKMRKLAEIPLQPMRMGFDSIELKDSYVSAVRLAHRYGQKEMSNYVLYNFKDTPRDFYERLRINIELNEEFKHDTGTKTEIYSFPMRYVPLNAKSRDVDTGNPYWNPRYLRGVRNILNVMNGPVMPRKHYFLTAFGRDSEEFEAIISMPDEFIMNRLVPNWREKSRIEDMWMPYVREWMTLFFELSDGHKASLLEIIGANDKNVMERKSQDVSDSALRRLIEFHLKERAIVFKGKQ